MALTLSGTNGVVGAGFTLDSAGASVTAGIATFSSAEVGSVTLNSSSITVDTPAETEARVNINEGSTTNSLRLFQNAGESCIQCRSSQPLNIKAQSGAGTTSHLAFWTRNSERLRIASDGKVGIGTTTPTTALDVNGVISTGSVLSSGIVEVSNQPAVSANLATQTNHSGAPSTVPFDTKVFDHGGCFNATTSAATLNGISVPAHAFLPNVAGIYLVSVLATSGSSTSGSITDFHVALRKNSTDIGHFDADPKDTSPENLASGSVTMLVEMNGTSDFLIVKVGATTSGTPKHLGGGHNCTFSAHKLII